MPATSTGYNLPIHLCNIAMKLGRKLTWNPVAENFVGDEQANAMVCREQREP